MEEKEIDECIDCDMSHQRGWVEILRPAVSLLKFRLPWHEGVSCYLHGRLLVQAYAPCTSTESRLMVTAADLELGEKSYNNQEYMEQLMRHNTIGRASLHDL